MGTLQEDEAYRALTEKHVNLPHVLRKRRVAVEAAKSVYTVNGVGDCVSFLLRKCDLSTAADVIGALLSRIQSKDSTLSFGSVQEIIQLASKLLQSKFEEHIVRGLDLIRVVLVKYWEHLDPRKENLPPSMLASRALPTISISIASLKPRFDAVHKRSEKGTRLGDRCRVLEPYLSQF